MNYVNRDTNNFYCKVTGRTNYKNIYKVIQCSLHVVSGLSLLAATSLSPLFSSGTSFSPSCCSLSSVSVSPVERGCCSLSSVSVLPVDRGCCSLSSVSVCSVDQGFREGLRRDLLVEGVCLVRGLLLPTSELKVLRFINIYTRHK